MTCINFSDAFAQLQIDGASSPAAANEDAASMNTSLADIQSMFAYSQNINWPRGPRGMITHESIIQEVGRRQRLFDWSALDETYSEWLTRRYRASMFRERNYSSNTHYHLNHTQYDCTKRNFRWAFLQACVHRRLHNMRTGIISIYKHLQKIFPTEIVHLIVNLAL